MTIDKSWTQIRKRSNSTVFWQGLQSFLQMAKSHVNDRGFIRCPCNRCINNAQHQLEVLETHIHRFGFMSDYNEWIYHGENVYAASSSNVLHPNSGKNICDSLLGTLMGDPHKSKDTDNARRDLQNLVRFVTHARDVRLKTQNSGVSVPGTENEMFYG
ncbi:hypothetical protein UlMin_028901 [Ulmus minor]